MEYKDLKLNGKLIRVFKNGNIHRFKIKKGEFTTPVDEPSGWKDLKSNYIRIQINNKCYYIHRVVAFAFLGLDIKNTELKIDHKNHNTEDNSVDNLEVCTQSQNQQNRSNIKGYRYNKKTKKYQAFIMTNNKRIYGGHFDTEEEAHARYLELKMIHHEYYRDVICSQ